MSRRIEQQSEITDQDLAKAALDQAKISYEQHGQLLRLRSGELANAVIDLRSGNITGDSDFGHTETKFGLLRQYYGEAKVRQDYMRTGTTIESRSISKEGDIVLMWATA